MKILFVDPPFHRFMGFYRFLYPIGLAYMASVLKRHNHEVLIYDAEHSSQTRSMAWSEVSRNFHKYQDALKNRSNPVWQEFTNILKEFKPDVVGITMLSVKVPSAGKIAALTKAFNKDIMVIVGADHPTVFPSETLNDPNIDIVVRGEGERTIEELIGCLEKKGDLIKVAGISFKKNRKIIHNKNRLLIKDLDNLPYPAIDTLIDYNTYRPLDFGAIMASRGCPYSCTFCGVSTVWSRKVRFRSADSVMDEIIWLHEKYGTDFFSFRDASFTLDRRKIVELCEKILTSGLKIKWECTTRPDLLEEPILALFKASGCNNIRIGVESGSDLILKKMKKKVDLNGIRRAAKLLNRYNFYWSAYFLFGSPHETMITFRQSLDFIKEIDPPFVTFARFAPIPGTEMYHELERAGLISPRSDWGMEGNQNFPTSYVFSMNENEIEKLMVEAVEFIEERNIRKEHEMNMRDSRRK